MLADVNYLASLYTDSIVITEASGHSLKPGTNLITISLLAMLYLNKDSKIKMGTLNNIQFCSMALLDITFTCSVNIVSQ